MAPPVLPCQTSVRIVLISFSLTYAYQVQVHRSSSTTPFSSRLSLQPRARPLATSPVKDDTTPLLQLHFFRSLVLRQILILQGNGYRTSDCEDLLKAQIWQNHVAMYAIWIETTLLQLGITGTNDVGLIFDERAIIYIDGRKFLFLRS